MSEKQRPANKLKKLSDTLTAELVEPYVYRLTSTAATGEPVVSYVETMPQEALAKLREENQGPLDLEKHPPRPCGPKL